MIKSENGKLETIRKDIYTDGSFVYKHYSHRPEDMMTEVEALTRVKDVPRTQQIESYNPIRKILVTRLIPGRNVGGSYDAFAKGELRHTSEQLRNLLTTLDLMCERGVGFETHEFNLIFHPDQGFTPIDYDLNPCIELKRLIDISSGLYPHDVQESLHTRLKRGAETKEMIIEMLRDVNPARAKKEIERMEWQERSNNFLRPISR